MARYISQWFVPMVLVVMALLAVVQPAGAAHDSADLRRANGTWRSDDGTSTGTWDARYWVSDTGVVEGVMSFTGMGESKPIQVLGQVEGDRITFGSATRVRDDAGNTEAVWNFEGVIRGVQIKGTYTDANGQTGRWTGFWTASERQRKARAAEAAGAESTTDQ